VAARSKRRVINVRWFGAKGVGYNDDTTALNAAALFGLRKKLYLLAGDYGVTAILSMSATCTIFGDGRDVTRIKVLGTGELDGLLSYANASHVTIRDISMIGNNVASSFTAGAISFTVTPAATVELRNIMVDNIHLENFKHSYWIGFVNGDALNTAGTRGIYLRNIDIKSVAGNCIDYANIGQISAGIMVKGNPETLLGYWRDLTIENYFCDGTGIKQGAIIYANVQNITYINYHAINCGAQLATGDKGGYGALFYSDQYLFHTDDPDYYRSNIKMFGVTIEFAKQIGIYMANVDGYQINGSRISGVLDSNVVSLQKGAIALNACIGNGLIENIDLIDNWMGVSVLPGVSGHLTIAPTIKSVAGNAIGMEVIAGSTSCGSVTINSPYIHCADITSSGLRLVSANPVSRTFSNIIINSPDISAGFEVLRGYDQGGLTGIVATGKISINGGTLRGAASASFLNFVSSTSELHFNGLSIDMSAATGAGAGFGALLGGATNRHIAGLKFCHRAAAAGYAGVIGGWRRRQCLRHRIHRRRHHQARAGGLDGSRGARHQRLARRLRAEPGDAGDRHHRDRRDQRQIPTRGLALRRRRLDAGLQLYRRHQLIRFRNEQLANQL
jgi:Pectate lyase superfamily protein